ncbi:unnamed protein product [Owenia fusiformis]|uniref:Sulfatase N-terminal domain-containing protein n=1 Tax=Owenia fusiformis TaxID=6347 RepID=A0A8S4PTB9_OWEFU|nr:unnamed protein product [Owenia fusiformis]
MKLQVGIISAIVVISMVNGDDCDCAKYGAIKRTTEDIIILMSSPPDLADTTSFVKDVENSSSILDKYKRDCLKSKIKKLQKKVKVAVSVVNDWASAGEPTKQLKRKMKSSLKKVLRLANSLLKGVDDELSTCDGEPVVPTTPEDTSEVLPGQPPNIIMVIFNSLGYTDVGFHNEYMMTPTLDRLAKSAVLLDNYYVQPRSSHTRANIMIGKSHFHTGQQGDINLAKAHCMPCDCMTVAERLREANYSTHLVGQWHLGFYTKYCLPQNRGFDTFFGTYGGNDMDHFEHITCRCSSNQIQDRECRLKWCGLDLHNTDGSPAWDAQGTYSTTLFKDKSVDIINTQPRNKPFFLVTSFTAPAGFRPPSVDEFEKMQTEKLKTTSGARTAYGGMVTAIDSAIQDIIDALKERGIQNNTVVIITNDRSGSDRTNIDNLSFSWPLRGSRPRYWEGGIWGLGIVTAPWIPGFKRSHTFY